MLTAVGMTASADMRTWTNKKTGSTIQAEAVSLNMSSKSVTLKTDAGKTVSMPFAKLSDEDITWLKENKDFIGKGAVGKPSGIVAESFVGKTKVLKDGEMVAQDGKLNAQYFILYFSASWCGPCRACSPHSVKFYNSEVKDNKKVELIMCSGDNNPAAAEKWAKENKMPWPILMPGSKSDFAAKVPVQGYPTAFIYDKDGNLLGQAHGASIDKLMGYVK